MQVQQLVIKSTRMIGDAYSISCYCQIQMTSDYYNEAEIVIYLRLF